MRGNVAHRERVAVTHENMIPFTAKERNERLAKLAEIEGMTVMEMLEEGTFDSVARGICRNCDYTTQVEPDSLEGWCENCCENTVISCLVLAGVI